jgi:hypothetical protein
MRISCYARLFESIAFCLRILACCSLLAAQSGSYLMTTVAAAGCCGGGSLGDSGPAINASFNGPAGLAIDASGNIYVVDVYNNRVRKFAVNGTISTFAGNGTNGSGGDGDVAIFAQLNLSFNTGLAFNTAGDLFITECNNGRIRKVTSQGIITTFAGNGSYGFAGDGGQATAAEFGCPSGVAVDAGGNVYVADRDNNRVRMVNPQGIVTTVAGSGTPPFSGDGGPATLAQITSPTGIAVDTAGNVFVTDGSTRVRKFFPGGLITTFAGNGTSGNTGDGGPAANASISASVLAIDNANNLYIGAAITIRRVTPWGTISTVVGGGFLGSVSDGGPAADAYLPVRGLAVDSSGDIFVSDSYRVRQLVPSPTSTAGCTYRLDHVNSGFDAPGGGATVGLLTTASTCPWMAGSTTSWMTVSGSGIHTGTGVIAYSVAPNQSHIARGGYIWAAGQNLQIWEGGAPCTFTVSPTTVSVPATGVTSATLAVVADNSDCRWSGYPNDPWILMSGASGMGNGTITYTVGVNTGAARTATATIAGQTITFNQAGATTIDLSNTAVFRPVAGQGLFSLNLDQSTYNYSAANTKSKFFGLAGDQPVAGDWDGTGVVRIGVFRAGAWYLDLNNNGAFDPNEGPFYFGLPGDIAVAGDWNGTGVTRPGVFRCPPPTSPGVCTWYLSTAMLSAPNTNLYSPSTTIVATFGLTGDRPVVNDWSGTTHHDQIGVFRCPAAGVCTWIVDSIGLGAYSPSDPVYYFGLNGDLPVVGDWNGNNQPRRIGVFRTGQWILDTPGLNAYSPADTVAFFGLPGDIPLVGWWSML